MISQPITKLFFSFALLTLAFTSPAQNLTGIWTGGLSLDTTGIRVINPGYIVHIKEQADNVIRGKAYVVERKWGFEGVLDFIGTIKGDLVMINEVRIRSSKTPVDTMWLCIKTLKMGLSPERTKMTGTWTGHLEVLDPCIPAKAYLMRYNPNSSVKIPPNVMSYILTDPGPSDFNGTRLSDPTAITVANRSVTISLIDYQREDNDTVTVYLNREAIVQKLGISAKPYSKEIRLNRQTGMNEVIVFANNLGRVPPNTCTMIVDDGVSRQSVNIVTTRQVSAAVYLRYEAPVKNGTVN